MSALTPITLLENMTEAVLVLSVPDYQIEYANPAVQPVFGYSPAELVGQKVDLLYPSPNNFEAFTRKQAAAISQGRAKLRIEQLLRKKDSSLLWTETNTTLVNPPQNQRFLIYVVHDISERSLLLSTAAHELRSPLAILTGLSGVLLEEDLTTNPDNSLRLIELIHKTTTAMSQMLDTLLNLTAFELGNVQLTLETVDITALIHEQVERYQFKAGQKQIRLIENTPDTPLNCTGDPIAIAQVIANLIDNALKYSPAGAPIQLTIRQTPGEIRVEIKDEGPGIIPAEQPYLFKSLGNTKIKSRPTSGEPSSGLGLMICKKIIDLHGGKIGVISSAEPGSTFWFSLPAAPPA